MHNVIEWKRNLCGVCWEWNFKSLFRSLETAAQALCEDFHHQQLQQHLSRVFTHLSPFPAHKRAHTHKAMEMIDGSKWC
jgi:hypothetical protein